MGLRPLQETHAATTGPAHAPLPASSTPKIKSVFPIFLREKGAFFLFLY